MTPPLADESELVRKSSKRSVDGLARSASCLSEAHNDGTTGLTNYVGDANLDWGGAGVVTPTKLRTLSFRKAVRTSSFRKRDQVSRARRGARGQVEARTLGESAGANIEELTCVVDLCAQVVAKLPKSWKRVEEEAGVIVYVNSVTNQRTSEVRRQPPCANHSPTRQSPTPTMPSTGAPRVVPEGRGGVVEGGELPQGVHLWADGVPLWRPQDPQEDRR